MVDDSSRIPTKKHFCPSDKPHGMKSYILKDLTPEQQIKLNFRKAEQVRLDQKYLSEHPEVRGIIFMILRRLMKSRPTHNIHDVIASYFTKSSIDIKEEVNAYLKTRENILAVNSTILKQKARQVAEVENNVIDYNSIDAKEEVGEDEEEAASRFEESIRGSVLHENTQGLLDPNNSLVKMCTEVLDEVIDNVFEAEDLISLLSLSETISADVDGPVITSLNEEESDDSITYNNDKIMNMKN